MRLFLFVLLIMFLTNSAFCEKAVELDVGLSSPNKGLVGARFSPTPMLSFGLILGSISNFTDLGIAYSYHFSEYRARGLIEPYIFQSHHYLKSTVGNMWEINTGGGAQYIFKPGFLVYAELGIPFYVGGYQVWRDYRNGVPRNRTSNGQMILVSLRSGIGVGYRFEL